MLIKFIFLCIYIMIWAGLTDFFTNGENLHFLIVAPLLTLAFSIWFNLIPGRNILSIKAIFYCGYLLKEIIISAWVVSKIVWQKHIILQPALRVIKTIQDTDVGTVIYANSITLTPGTVTLSTQGEHLLIHALDYNSINSLEEGDMDRRIKAIIK